MTYSSKFVMLVKSDGQPLHEHADSTIRIPFGANYTLWFKNKHKRRALVKVFVDGENVSEGGYIIKANDSLELKRHALRDTAFKFVEMDSAEALMEGKTDNKDGEKGVIEARFYLEKKSPKIAPKPMPYPQPYPVPYPYPVEPYGKRWPWKPYWPDVTWTSNSSSMDGGTTQISCNAAESSLAAPSVDRSTLMDGCTVEGATTGQTFYEVPFEAETDYVTIKVVLRGYSPRENRKEMPVVTENDTYCTSCGQKKGRKCDKFCGKCGNRI